MEPSVEKTYCSLTGCRIKVSVTINGPDVDVYVASQTRMTSGVGDGVSEKRYSKAVVRS